MSRGSATLGRCRSDRTECTHTLLLLYYLRMLFSVILLPNIVLWCGSTMEDDHVVPWYCLCCHAVLLQCSWLLMRNVMLGDCIVMVS